jgi:glycosyltransferase involved in cell wall biosynthesis
MNTKILMFGWEFPPNNSGGLGVACHGITKAMSAKGDEVTFVLPRKMETETSTTNFVFPSTKSKIIIHAFNSIISPYITKEMYKEEFQSLISNPTYSPNLVDEVYRYSSIVETIPNLFDFDVIHCHDWLTVPAALRAKEIIKKPLVLHIHATEFDRTGSFGNSDIFEIEKLGLEQADKIIAVSEFTKQSIISNYNIQESKIEVVHNGVDADSHTPLDTNNIFIKRLKNLKDTGYQIVLFTGRLTFQKGVEYLLDAAKKSLKFNQKTLFIIVGSGDMEIQLIKKASELRISDRVIFTGFLRGEELKSMYSIADLFVMPSVSEPFGLVALESALHNTPILISKQSGVCEVMSNSLKCDFWDIDDMTDKMVAVLEYESLQRTLITLGNQEAKELNWHKAVDKIKIIYSNIKLQNI